MESGCPRPDSARRNLHRDTSGRPLSRRRLWLDIAVLVCFTSLTVEIFGLLVSPVLATKRIMWYSSVAIGSLYLWRIKKKWGTVRLGTGSRRSLRIVLGAAEAQWWVGLAVTTVWNLVTGYGISKRGVFGEVSFRAEWLHDAAHYAMTVGFSFWMSLTYLAMLTDPGRRDERSID